MLAIYYVESSTPANMIVHKTDCNGDHMLFLEELSALELPMPSSDVVFIENDEVVDYVNFNTGKQFAPLGTGE
jgi:Ni2+-binding GTPase involved in maturation of urease and hydrogenase